MNKLLAAMLVFALYGSTAVLASEAQVLDGRTIISEVEKRLWGRTSQLIITTSGDV